MTTMNLNATSHWARLRHNLAEWRRRTTTRRTIRRQAEHAACSHHWI